MTSSRKGFYLMKLKTLLFLNKYFLKNIYNNISNREYNDI